MQATCLAILPVVQENLKLLIVAIIVLSVLPGVIEIIRHKRGGGKASEVGKWHAGGSTTFLSKVSGCYVFNVQHSWSVGGKNGIIRLLQQNWHDQVQAERLSMSWIERIKSNITPTRKASIPEGVWTKCDSCGQVLYRAELERNLERCVRSVTTICVCRRATACIACWTKVLW